jgi:hypothetical protein
MEGRPLSLAESIQITLFSKPAFRFKFLGVFTPEFLGSSLGIREPSDIGTSGNRSSIRQNIIFNSTFLVSWYRRI